MRDNAEPSDDGISIDFIAATLQLLRAAQQVNDLATDERFPNSAESIGEMHRENYALVARTVSRVLRQFDN